MRLFFVLTFILIGLSCSVKKEIDNRVVYFDDLESVNYFVSKDFKTAKLTNDDINVIDEVLEMAILNNEFSFLNENNLVELKKYYRQVLVYKDSNNDKCVYINAICKVHDGLNWKEEMFSVADGGPCYWNIKINLTKKTYHDLIVNGYA